MTHLHGRPLRGGERACVVGALLHRCWGHCCSAQCEKRGGGWAGALRSVRAKGSDRESGLGFDRETVLPRMTCLTRKVCTKYKLVYILPEVECGLAA